MYNQSGIDGGIAWSVQYNGGRSFTITVGELQEAYECQYEPVFGIDFFDGTAINAILDKLFDQATVDSSHA